LVETDDQWDTHIQELQCEVEVSLEDGSTDDIDDGTRLFVGDVFPGDQFFE